MGGGIRHLVSKNGFISFQNSHLIVMFIMTAYLTTALSQYVEFHKTHHNRQPGNNVSL